MHCDTLHIKVQHFIYKIAVIHDERLKQLSTIPSFAGRVRFCNTNFQKLQAGSSRIAYEYSPELVVKLAKNEKGLYQNNAESDQSLQSNYKDMITNVVDSDPNNLWLIAERAKKITPSEFNQLAGIKFKDLEQYVRSKLGGYTHFILPKEIDDNLNENEFVSRLMDMIVNYSLQYGDIIRLNSWGKVNGRLVLLDYGLTKDIFTQYYK